MLDIQKYIWKPKILVTQIDDKTSKFEVQYLPRGFGNTLWNSLRRSILGYDIWWSVTWLKIKWAPHEYHIIDWVKESVLNIMLNFKKLRFKINENVEKVQWISQRFKWIGQYEVKDLKLPSWVEVLSDDVYLFEITDSSTELVVDFRLEKWYWYYNMEFLRKRENEEWSTDIGLFLIDNDFKLVDYVKYDVEEVIDDFTWWTKDKLNIEIKTISPKILPQELLTFAWEVVSSYARLFVFDEAYLDKSVLVDYSELDESKERVTQMEVKTMPIDALPLSERTRNALIKNNILYVEDLEKKRKTELLTMKWVWRKAVDEITQALKNINKSLLG